ncbi:chromate efflux transporter [Thermoleophilia bacterium SCSIO 60948]|nr:chromate efflux transporter [Thermoleophilia bacterium SCSIO 60948]
MQQRPDTPLSIFWRFLRFGGLAWGGPAAQIAMIKAECVDELGWTDEETFKRTLAVYQVLPGPEAHELCVYFGRIRAGKLGGFAAGLGFMLPGLVLMLGLSALYVEASLASELDELFYGLNAAVGAILARALIRLSSTFLTNAVLWVIAAAAFVLTLATGALFWLVLLGGGVVYELWTNASSYRGRASSVLALPLAIPVAIVAALTLPLAADILWVGLKAGLVTFGGAFTVVPFLQETAVEGQGWLTSSQFIDGLAIGGVLPAPFVIVSTFVGYLAGGLGGALLITFGVFLPAFVFPIFGHGLLVRLAGNERARAFLLGVAAAVVGLIAAVAVGIIRTSVVDVGSALLLVASFAALMRWHAKASVVVVVLGAGLVGWAIQLATG